MKIPQIDRKPARTLRVFTMALLPTLLWASPTAAHTHSEACSVCEDGTHASRVALGPGVFYDAMQANRDYLLAHDPDRLLAPFLREAGLEPKQPPYGNWESSGLDGHTAGHYLSALAFMVASGGDNAQGELRKRLDSMLAELERCQQAGGTGYIGGVPDGFALWQEIAEGKIEAHGFGLNNRWVPLYNIHKTFAGLRDAWTALHHPVARQLLVNLGDWWVELMSQLSDAQVQDMLRSEHGGMNEVLADLYAITGEQRYLEVAKRTHHRAILEPLMDRRDELTGMHANTQIPKVIGLARVGALTEDERAMQGAEFFWETVTQRRSVAFGGNSVREHFNDPFDFREVVEDRQGPETCNTYNMLRLTQQLFEAEPQARYADYYERALYNHILASIHPDHPGYVYFTPLRPQHYRVYSEPELCFWCCVGSGMENPGKYGDFIYSVAEDGGIYVNLFIASELQLKQGGQLVQDTRFPYESQTRFQFALEAPQSIALRLRHPSWVPANELRITLNGAPLDIESMPSSYVEIERTWSDGDRVEVELPMQLHTETLPDGSNWVSLLYGPLVMAAPSGTEDLTGLRADDSRMGHVAHGPVVPLDQVPVLREEVTDLAACLDPDPSGEPLTFRLRGALVPEPEGGLQLRPFFGLHDQRYQLVWQRLSVTSIKERQEQLAATERERALREAATLDRVAIGEQQSEVEHGFEAVESETGILDGKRWRHGREFSYVLDPRGMTEVELEVTYWGGDENREFAILMNGEAIATQVAAGDAALGLYRVRYPVPEKLLQSADGPLRVTFRAQEGLAGGVFDLRLMRTDSNPEL